MTALYISLVIFILLTNMQVQHKSFLGVPEDSDFPLENIPFGVVSTKSNPNDRFPATRIGKLSDI